MLYFEIIEVIRDFKWSIKNGKMGRWKDGKMEKYNLHFKV